MLRDAGIYLTFRNSPTVHAGLISGCLGCLLGFGELEFPLDLTGRKERGSDVKTELFCKQSIYFIEQTCMYYLLSDCPFKAQGALTIDKGALNVPYRFMCLYTWCSKIHLGCFESFRIWGVVAGRRTLGVIFRGYTYPLPAQTLLLPTFLCSANSCLTQGDMLQMSPLAKA